jgi:hypothetical protein
MSPAAEAPTAIEKKLPTEKELAIRQCNKASRTVRIRFLDCLLILVVAVVVARLRPAPGLIAIVDEWAMIFSFFLVIIFFLWFFGLRIKWARLYKQPEPPAPPKESEESGTDSV